MLSSRVSVGKPATNAGGSQLPTREAADDAPIKIRSQMGPFAMVPAWVSTMPITDGEFRIYVAIRSFCAGVGECWPKARTIAERARPQYVDGKGRMHPACSVSAVRNAVARFRQLGILETEPEYQPGTKIIRCLHYYLVDLDPRIPHPRSARPVQPSPLPQLAHPPTSAEVDPLPELSDTPYLSSGTQGEETTEETKEETKENPPLPPGDQLTPACAREEAPQAERRGDRPPADQPQAATGGGGESPEKPKPEKRAPELSNAERSTLGEAKTRTCELQPGWSATAVTDVMVAAIEQGRTAAAVAAAIVALAEGRHGHTSSPRRLLADGPWWAASAQAHVTAPADRRPLCPRHHQRHDGTCPLCAEERSERRDPQQRMDKATAIAAIRALGGRRTWRRSAAPASLSELFSAGGRGMRPA